MRTRHIVVILLVVVGIAFQPAWAQWVVHDPITTARNAVTAVLKSSLIQALTRERDRLNRMAARLSALTSLRRYAADEVPRWRTHAWDTATFPYAAGYHAALNYGDASGRAYFGVARSRRAADGALLSQLPPRARDAVTSALATLDAADSMLVASTHQTGALRFNGRRELAAIDALERQVVDADDEQSMTAVLDTVSGAVLIEARQKQARIQLLAAVAEHLILENKRSRDAEAAGLNMQLNRLRDGRGANASLLAGSGADFRAWTQP